MKRFLTVFTALILCLLSLTSCFGGGETPNDDTTPEDDAVYWGKVSGIVTENDEPLAGVTVTSGSRSVTTDKNGKYTIEVYSDGATLSFTKDGCITQKKTFKSSSFYRDEITYDLIMFLSTKVYGVVVDESGAPVGGASVSIGDQRMVTGDDGYYEFESVIGTSMVIIVTKGDKTARGAVFADEMREGSCEVADIILK